MQPVLDPLSAGHLEPVPDAEVIALPIWRSGWLQQGLSWLSSQDVSAWMQDLDPCFDRCRICAAVSLGLFLIVA
jgi:hypothetical protein